MRTPRETIRAVAILIVLASVAVVAPMPAESNRDFYEHSGQRVLMPGCQGGDCFRPLIPVALERLPGSSLVKWKTYAVVANTIGALAVGRLSLLLGLSATGAVAATWLSALGAGALYSIYDAYSSDALMYLLGPVMAVWLWRGKYLRAAAAGTVGLFAKEFAAVPLWIFAIFAALERRWNAAVRLGLTAATVTLIWLVIHAGYMTLENYAYGSTASADLLHGGFLATWLYSVRLKGALAYLFTSFSAAYLLWGVGLARGPRELTLLAVAAVPALVAFVYVEQPERALWNFHFIAIPLAALVLEDLPGWTIALFVASFGVANLRFGAQLPIRGAARAALVVSLAIAAVAAVRALARVKTMRVERPADLDAPLPRIAPWTLAGAQAVACILLVVALLDVRAHRRSDGRFGVNQWGFRGTLTALLHPGVRIAMLGGSAAFAAQTPWTGSIPQQLASDINAKMGWTRPGGVTASIANLAEPGAGAESYTTTLRDYAYLHPDIVCIYDGYDNASATGTLGRHRSVVFRLTGYLPRSPAALMRADDGHETDAAPDPLLRRETPSDVSCGGASAPYCAAMSETVRAALQRGQSVLVATPLYLSDRHEAQQRSLAERLTHEFGRDARFRYVDLGRAIDVRDPAMATDPTHPTLAGSRALAVQLADAILPLVRAKVQ
jgi:hypothetical protein